MHSAVEQFVQRAVAERFATVLLAAPEEAGARLLRGWVEALGARHRAHVTALVHDARWAETLATGQLLLTLIACDGERSPDQALRNALRQDPDVIVCERRAAPALEMLLVTAETGHQVLAHLPGGLEAAEQASGYPLGAVVHLGVEADGEGIARLIRFAGPGRAREVLWDRASPGPLPAEVPGRAPPPPRTPPSGPEPLPAAVIAAARAGLGERLRATWLPILAEPGGEAACSKLGGRPMLAPGEAWPACPTCARALPLALQLRREELPAAAAACFPPDAGWLQLFYCDSPDCACEQAALPAGRNRLLRWLAADAVPAGAPPSPLGDEGARTWSPADVSGWEERREGPHVEDLGELDEAALVACLAVREQVEDRRRVREEGGAPGPEVVDEAELEALGGARAGDKLLGWPAWEQGPEWSACPRCGARRTLLFQLDAWRGRLTSLFAADGRGHVSACPEHPEELAFAWACG